MPNSLLCQCPRRDSNSQAAYAAGDFESLAAEGRNAEVRDTGGARWREFPPRPSPTATVTATTQDLRSSWHTIEVPRFRAPERRDEE